MEQSNPLEILNQLDPELLIKPGFNNQAVVTFLRNKIEDKRPFGITGPIKYKGSYYKNDRLDPFDRIIALSKTGQRVFTQVRDNRCKDINISTISDWKDLNKTQTRFIQRGLKDLIEHKIICKCIELKKFSFFPEAYTFMISPYFIKCNKYNLAKDFWFEFTGETEQDYKEEK